MADAATESSLEAQPYPPSWIDRFHVWVENLPVRAWIFYVLLGIALVLVQVLFLGLESGPEADELLPIIVFNGLFTPFLLALIHFLDRQAVVALNSMRPVIEMPEPGFAQYEYRLANMPFLAPLVAGLAVTAIVIVMERIWMVPVRYAALDQRPVFTTLFYIIDKSSAFLFGVIVYHTIRQLRLVNAINTNHIRVNLFNLRPLQAFSRLTASTAVGLVAGVYGWMLINPELLRDPVSLVILVGFTALAVVVFVWPLVGAHRLMEKEKERMLRDIDHQFEAAFAMFNQRFQDEDYTEMDRLHGMISSLEIQHRKIKAIPTWPWRPETVRPALTAIALPLILWVLQYLVEQVLDW
jgi:hypothetical protein